MKISTLFLLLFSGLFLPKGIAQQPQNQDTFAPKPQGNYRTWVLTDHKKFKGQLVELRDSSLLLRRDADLQVVPVSQINQIKVRKKGQIARGLLIGFASGAVLGAAIGFADGDDPPCQKSGWFSICIRYTAEEKALMNGLGLGLVGTIVGGIVGGVKIKIPIWNNQDVYQNQKIRLGKYLVPG